jgi:adenylate cyclase
MTGYRPARLYLVAWIGIISGFIILPMKNFGLLPHNLFTDYSILMGSAFEIILMSLALADRMRIMQREKESVQREAFERQKETAESFSRFVPKEFLRYLDRENIAEIKLGDQSIREMTVLFSDIRSFTKISERMSPKENIDFLNSYLQKIAPIIRSNNGFIDKYIGDAIMALFPESVDDAINAAIQMHRALRELNDCYRLCGETDINIGVGIHTGTLVLGTIGEENRMDTTVISDAVNTASRLEGLNKKLNTKILLSMESFDKAADRDKYPHRMIGLVRIRGKANPIRVVEILQEAIA